MTQLRLAVPAASTADPPTPTPSSGGWVWFQGPSYSFSTHLSSFLFYPVSLRPCPHVVWPEIIRAEIWELTQVNATEAKTLILMPPFCAWPVFLHVCVFNILFSCASVSHMWSWRGVGLSALARSWDFVFLSITHTHKKPQVSAVGLDNVYIWTDEFGTGTFSCTLLSLCTPYSVTHPWWNELKMITEVEEEPNPDTDGREDRSARIWHHNSVETLSIIIYSMVTLVQTLTHQQCLV